MLFGTGKAVGEIVGDKQKLTTYHPQSFVDLKAFFVTIPTLISLQEADLERYFAKLPPSISQFLGENDFFKKLTEIQGNTTSLAAFKNRFYRWFNAFLLMKFVHFSRDEFYPNIDVREAAIWCLREKGMEIGEEITTKELLFIFRELDKA